ncbi:hypothetical protein C7C56_016160 [Massilia glaciei]|uniref:SGNH/GDSL hydrolase family protein n=2 Tax=Massilia glaciei TaxID=1524097 RepID=A0A2U2HIK6_9BURK|nr:hypothetical protein C7C56_016160 [Massilia glaciei]
MYVGNLPAVFDALAASNGRDAQSEMIAKGGHTLARHLSDGAASKALATGKFDYLVLQERGGDIIGSFGQNDRDGAKVSLQEFTRLATAARAEPIYLGTYQPLPAVSDALLKAEGSLADRLKLAYVPVSGHFRTAVAAAPEAAWLDKDGMHPGRDLTFLKAVLLYRQIFGALPAATAFAVEAVMAAPRTSAKSTHVYSKERVAVVLEIAATKDAIQE